MQLREVRNLNDGTLDMKELREKLRPEHPDPHEPYTSLVCIENTHNYCGGTVLSVEWIDQVLTTRKKYLLRIICNLDWFCWMYMKIIIEILLCLYMVYTRCINQAFVFKSRITYLNWKKVLTLEKFKSHTLKTLLIIFRIQTTNTVKTSSLRVCHR